MGIELEALKAENDLLREKIAKLEAIQRAMSTGKLQIVREICAEVVEAAKATINAYGDQNPEMDGVRRFIRFFNGRTGYDLKLE